MKLIIKHLEEQKKSFTANVRVGPREVDGVAPEGIDDLIGPTLIENELPRGRAPRYRILDFYFYPRHKRRFFG